MLGVSLLRGSDGPVLGVQVHQGQVRLSVGDNGSGIAPELLLRIFALFTQACLRAFWRAQAGLGIGLALVKHIIALHGGNVQAHSDGPRLGSEFTVMLPWVSHTPSTSSSDCDS